MLYERIHKLYCRNVVSIELTIYIGWINWCYQHLQSVLHTNSEDGSASRHLVLSIWTGGRKASPQSNINHRNVVGMQFSFFNKMHGLQFKRWKL